MPNVSPFAANLAVVVLESLLYGLYVSLASCTLYVMMTRRRERLNGTPRFYRSSLFSPVALGALALFITVTTHWLLTVARLFLAFHHWEDGPGPRLFYSDFSHITEVLKYGFCVGSLFIGDSLLIHRLWVVSGFRLRTIVFPIVTVTGLLPFGVGLTYQMSAYTSNDSMFQASYRLWTTGLCICCSCTAIYTTAFIWYKLWNLSRVLESFGSRGLSNIIRIFADSAALYATFGIFHLVSYQCSSNVQLIALDCLPVILGISNLLVQIRLHWDLAQKPESPTSLL
ncbi:hypothetical protein MVEN_00261200 [Mycena venus]|uniref:Uncharacterized protein n=1 Tax=Mycena venus TaxID=2733690 RepID=A0A8H6Z1R0_9AGAR|nr:hypothetical protein MVEN_00261200 [Mycena venus]